MPVRERAKPSIAVRCNDASILALAVSGVSTVPMTPIFTMMNVQKGNVGLSFVFVYFKCCILHIHDVNV